MHSSSARTQRAVQTCSGHGRQGHRVVIREDCLDDLVEHRDGQAVKVRSRSDDHLATSEGLLAREAPVRAEQFEHERDGHAPRRCIL